MIISIINNKGGVGKSTVTQNLGHALTIRGKKVLIIDMDPQSNTTSVLAPPNTRPTLFELFTNQATFPELIVPTPYRNLDVIPNCNLTDTTEISLYRREIDSSFFMLRDAARDYCLENYDITLIDLPPNLGMFVIMGLLTSDSAIVPIWAGSRYSLDGFKSAMDAILAAAQQVNHKLSFLRAVINMVDRRTTASRTSVEYLREHYGALIFETTIPRNADIQTAESNRQTVLKAAPTSLGTLRFKQLADELLKIIESPPRSDK